VVLGCVWFQALCTIALAMYIDRRSGKRADLGLLGANGADGSPEDIGRIVNRYIHLLAEIQPDLLWAAELLQLRLSAASNAVLRARQQAEAMEEVSWSPSLPHARLLYDCAECSQGAERLTVHQFEPSVYVEKSSESPLCVSPDANALPDARAACCNLVIRSSPAQC
jgi:hypothetical protein